MAPNKNMYKAKDHMDHQNSFSSQLLSPSQSHSCWEEEVEEEEEEEEENFLEALAEIQGESGTKREERRGELACRVDPMASASTWTPADTKPDTMPCCRYKSGSPALPFSSCCIDPDGYTSRRKPHRV
ncbi:hypothetical protein NQZ68_023238 [Dissostichus eleginoides]|nr:hypothetical protein NQZ68_023238 [Dissostichus eleginoides]